MTPRPTIGVAQPGKGGLANLGVAVLVPASAAMFGLMPELRLHPSQPAAFPAPRPEA